jgi:DNA-binding transcriptional regulator YhcF (GntR family)
MEHAMNAEFSIGVRRAMAAAVDEAHRLQHDYLGTEHILLGLLRDRESAAAAVLRALGVTREQLRGSLESAVRRGASTAMGELPYTSRSRNVVAHAIAEAGEEERVGTEHLLVGLLREENGIAAHVLTRHGAGLTDVRAAMAGGAAASTAGSTGAGGSVGGAVGGASAGASSTTFRVVLDDTAEQSICDQLVQRVQEAAATGELLPGARLPAVRRLADELDIAPGTVARAYVELERLGVVITEGARGTRVADRAADVLGEAAVEKLAAMLRPTVVAAYHMGAGAADLRSALECAMRDIFNESGHS